LPFVLKGKPKVCFEFSFKWKKSDIFIETISIENEVSGIDEIVVKCFSAAIFLAIMFKT
jgi:hypothetical protein